MNVMIKREKAFEVKTLLKISSFDVLARTDDKEIWLRNIEMREFWRYCWFKFSLEYIEHVRLISCLFFFATR